LANQGFLPEGLTPQSAVVAIFTFCEDKPQFQTLASSTLDFQGSGK
jgi:hypothetical protein